LNNFQNAASDYSPKNDVLIRCFNTLAFGTGEIRVNSQYVSATLRIDMKQDFSAFMMGRGWSNLPMQLYNFTPFTDANFPQIALAQYYKGPLLFSISTG